MYTKLSVKLTVAVYSLLLSSVGAAVFLMPAGGGASGGNSRPPVVPEPHGYILFLTGGAVLIAIYVLRKSKKR
ncbi:MAG: PEP-CTERM sorting domain-containing protein [Candidatus Kuenenia stuttgartiensis]|nr:PEP-CTERM sorting domain-containing protein [Candidatus Kuenenia stuttgartiensis]